MQEAWVWSLGWEDSPGGRLGNPFHYSYLENLHGQRSLLGYNPWSHKELDTTEQLSTTLPSPLQKEEFQVQKVKWPRTWGQQSQPQSPALDVTTGTTSNHPPCKAQAPCWGPGVPWPGVGNNSPRVGPSSPDSIPGLHSSKPLRKGCSHCSNRQATLGPWPGCSLELKITEATHPFCGPQSRGDSTQKGASFSGERKTTVCVWVCGCVCRVGAEICISRNWITWLWRLGKYKTSRVDQQAGDPEEGCNLRLKAICQQNSFFLQRGQSFFYSDPLLLEWGPLTVWWAICFIENPWLKY